MKKILAALLTVAVVLGMGIVPVAAVETNEEIIAVYEDGSYLVGTLTVITSDVSPWSSTIATGGNYVLTYCTGNNEAQWDYILYGNFLYRYGIGSQVQNRRDEYNIYKNQWSMVSHETTLDMTTAYGTIHMKKTVLFITTDDVTANVWLTCDMYGNITGGYERV